MLRKGEAPGDQTPPHLHKDDGDDDDDAPSGFVKLISAEGFEFVVDKKAAMVSNTLRNMLTSPGSSPSPSIDPIRFAFSNPRLP